MWARRRKRRAKDELKPSPQCFFCGEQVQKKGDNAYLFILDEERSRSATHICHVSCIDAARSSGVPSWPEDVEFVDA